MTTAAWNGSGGLRAGHEDRQRACEDLGRHYAAGRLTMAELEDRQGAAWTARTLGDLVELVHDLPSLHPAPLAPPVPTAWAAPVATWAPPAPTAWPAPPWPAPHGVDPRSGRPFSDRRRVVAGLLALLLGCLGAGRFYTGHVGLGVAQLLLTVLTGGWLLPLTVVWGLVEGLVVLSAAPKDRRGLPLR